LRALITAEDSLPYASMKSVLLLPAPPVGLGWSGGSGIAEAIEKGIRGSMKASS
jgi:hypothetical protein